MTAKFFSVYSRKFPCFVSLVFSLFFVLSLEGLANPTHQTLVLNPDCHKDASLDPMTKNADSEITVTAWNLLNLFDTKHDIENKKDKNDWQYNGASVRINKKLGYVSGPITKYKGCLKALDKGLNRCKKSRQEKSCVTREKRYFQGLSLIHI